MHKFIKYIGKKIICDKNRDVICSICNFRAYIIYNIFIQKIMNVSEKNRYIYLVSYNKLDSDEQAETITCEEFIIKNILE